MDDKAAAHRALLAAVWQRSLPTVIARLSTLDAAATAAQAGTIPADLRLEAHWNAHKLAGSLGMFGYPQGTLQAREIEHLLEPAAPSPDAAHLARLTQQLRAGLPL